MSFLLTLTKKAKNRRIKRNFIKNIFRAALSRAGYCLGHGLGLHLLPRQFHLPSFPGNIGHKSSLPVFPVNSSQQHRPAPEAVFPPEASPVFSASTAPHFQCHSRNSENILGYITNQIHYLLWRKFFCINTSNGDKPAAYIPIRGDEFRNRGFTRAGRPY